MPVSSMPQREAFNAGLFRFLQDSPTPFHAVGAATRLLEAAGFIELRESEDWTLRPGGRYWVSRNGSSLIAFVHGMRGAGEAGLRIVGAHTDSPCLRIKPDPVVTQHGYVQLGVETYGGVLLNPWFDRDLSIAGRLNGVTGEGALVDVLINLNDPIAVIPSLAIHLDRDANKSRSINAQQHLPAVVAQLGEKAAFSVQDWLLEHARLAHPTVRLQRILDWELCLYDVQPPGFVGINREFMASARLDNLLSCYAATQALCVADERLPAMVVLSDHEEVGSASAAGAQGTFLRDVLERWVGVGATLTQALQRSMLISADNAHGIHPNYADRHDPNHGPKLNGGVVIKVNANQRYASNSATQARFRLLAEATGVPVQLFVMRSDLACGSTIGPIAATELGIPTVDVGVPTFAMHSIRELAGSSDPHQLASVMATFFAASALH